MSRKIKDIKDKHTGELIYPRTHISAVVLSSDSTLEDLIEVKQDKIDDLDEIRAGAAKGATALQSSSLATVATSGNYNDLTNKPNIPAAVTETTVSGWGFTKNTGTYSKPSGGIPKTDLASAVQTSLGKADTALQSYTEQYKGTVIGVKINGTTKNPTSGVVDLGTVITAHQTLKTINGQSLIGSGDINISGGGSSDANVQAVDTGDVIDDVTVNYATTAYVDGKVANIDLTNYATTSYVDGLIGDINSTIGDINSVLESIINGGPTIITFTINGTEYQAEEGMTWQQWIDSSYYDQNINITIKTNGKLYIDGDPILCNSLQGSLSQYTTTEIVVNGMYDSI